MKKLFSLAVIASVVLLAGCSSMNQSCPASSKSTCCQSGCPAKKAHDCKSDCAKPCCAKKACPQS